MKRPQVTDELVERSKARIEEAQKAAIKKHSRGAFTDIYEIDNALAHQLDQISRAINSKNHEEVKKQTAQAAQVLFFGLASMETWGEE